MSGNTWIFLGIIAAAFAAGAIPYGYYIKSKVDNSPKEHVQVVSNQQSGGITAANIENLNITNTTNSTSNINIEKSKRDIQTALTYQTEIHHFYCKFKTCLNWTLPTGNNVDNEVDKIFNYGQNYAQAINLNKITKEIIVKIFTKYDFAKPMQNFYNEKNNFKPTGFNNILGILKYFNSQLEKYMNKYGSSTSSDLTLKIEYMQRMVDSIISSIRLDLNSSRKINSSTIKSIAELFYLMREDFFIMKKNYTSQVTGGFPVVAGKVLKSDAKNGEMMVETQFSDY
jgi:hypothetical protein